MDGVSFAVEPEQKEIKVCKKSTNVAFGFHRGKCQEDNCPCAQYATVDGVAGGPCRDCTHFPHLHENLGVTDALDEEEEENEEDERKILASIENQPSIDSMGSAGSDASTEVNRQDEADQKQSMHDDISQHLSSMHDHSWAIAGNELHFKDKIGSGTAAKVYKGEYRNTHVAIKVLKSTFDMKQVENFKKELDILCRIHSPYIVQFYGCCIHPKICLVIEYCSRGSLYHVLQSKVYNISWRMVLQIALKATRGLEVLHDNSIVHRDLKSLNLLVTTDWHVKVADFGLSRLICGDINLSTLGKMRGTFAYCAPEVYFGERFSQKSDIYSMGIILWELMNRCILGQYSRPYSDHKNLVFDFQIIVKTAKQKLRPTCPESCPPPWLSMLRRCWAHDPEERPVASEIAMWLDEMLENYNANGTQWEDTRQYKSDAAPPDPPRADVKEAASPPPPRERDREKKKKRGSKILGLLKI
eukprot:CAMPEP_0177657726 /NCGR_PEP_ID=MMETSP0447-20121125/16370_1 /TAXON_ID=0 /ORGANISM="Stygamoeba regulata, Strain BSH-02190019" /LENGTH=470 /DNA_ID=CAMNT_0019162163 /DNA_START=243 /DNA_END=1655 /DNA_ORIENTATION=+